MAGDELDVAGGRRGGSQRIPRPDDFRPGGLAPWAHLPPARHHDITVDTVRQAMARRGPDAAPFSLPREPIVAGAAGRRMSVGAPAAVLCALFDVAGEAHVILTRRSSTMRSHTGEVSFPGGRLEQGEAPVTAALREAREEIGLDPEHVEIIGTLSPLATYQGQVVITPFVGVLAVRPVLAPCAAEVERAFDVSLAELVSAGVYREEQWLVPGNGYRAISFFEVEGDTVWGATAWMLRQLLELVLMA